MVFCIRIFAKIPSPNRVDEFSWNFGAMVHPVEVVTIPIGEIGFQPFPLGKKNLWFFQPLQKTARKVTMVEIPWNSQVDSRYIKQ